jgi:zinc/manganese transport system substrate-binding protein
MTNHRTLLKSATAAVALSLGAPALAQSNQPIPVVATFSILGDMVERIGGDHVAVTTLVGPNGDAHVYQPTPQAARAVSEAEMLVVNGLQFEGWLDRLIEASDFDGRRVVATAGIEPIAFDGAHDHGHEEHAHEEHAHEEHAHGDGQDHAHGDEAGHDHAHDHENYTEAAGRDHDDHAEAGHDEAGHDGHDHGAFDPHAWQSLDNAVSYVDTITAALAEADPENAATFYENRAAYVAEIEALDAEIREIVSDLPEERRIVVTSHDAFQYFERDYGLTFLSPQGISTESEASAQDVAHLIETIRDRGVSAVFFENIADTRLLERIADETGATIGGTLYPGALSEPDGPAPTYLDMMRHNATTLAQALGS